MESNVLFIHAPYILPAIIDGLNYTVDQIFKTLVVQLIQEKENSEQPFFIYFSIISVIQDFINTLWEGMNPYTPPPTMD